MVRFHDTLRTVFGVIKVLPQPGATNILNHIKWHPWDCYIYQAISQIKVRQIYQSHGWYGYREPFLSPDGFVFSTSNPPIFVQVSPTTWRKSIQPSINKKMNGTESQRTPQVSCNRAIRYLGLGLRSVGPVGDFLDSSLTANETDETGRRIFPSFLARCSHVFRGLHFRGKGVKHLTT